MVKDNLLKIIDQYKKYTFSKATKNIIYHALTREQKKYFGTLNPEKIFYVIRSIDDKSRFYIGPKNNLLANYFYVLSHIQYAINNGWIPIIDQLNYPVYNSVDFPINGTMNAWEYYWKQPCNYTLEEVYQSKNVVLSKQNWFSEYDMGYDVEKYKNPEIIHRFYELSKIIPFNEETENIIEGKCNSLFGNKKNILGVAFRFGGHSQRHFEKAVGHPIQPEIDEMIKVVYVYLNKWNMDYIFLTSDTDEAIKEFQHVFGNKLIFLERKRFSENLKKGEKNKIYLKNNLYQTSIDYLTEMALLSKCDCFISSINSGMRYALIRNNNKYKNVKILNYGLVKKEEY